MKHEIAIFQVGDRVEPVGYPQGRQVMIVKDPIFSFEKINGVMRAKVRCALTRTNGKENLRDKHVYFLQNRIRLAL